MGDTEGGLLWTAPGEPGVGGSRVSGCDCGEMEDLAIGVFKGPFHCLHTFRFR